MMLLLPSLILLGVQNAAFPSQAPPSPLPPTAQVAQGKIRGDVATYKTGKKYQLFKGIPYAKPPIGDLRFAKPVPHPGFPDGEVFQAVKFGPSCLQGVPEAQGFNSTLLSEDCLTLNIFAPINASGGHTSFPVLIFIHGGGFVGGSASGYAPGKLVTENDVIVVTLQYRLGIFGFLSTGDSAVPGNYGLWDQNFAIRWIKTNIAAFGGNPDLLTVSGESAGSASVSLQALSPFSNDLFHKGLLQSGTATSGWAVTRNPRRFSQALADTLGCKMPAPLGAGSSRGADGGGGGSDGDGDVKVTVDEFLQCLRRAPAESVALAGNVSRSLAWTLTAFAFVPCVDGEFIPDDPHSMLSDSHYLDQIGFYNRDYMAGVVNNEGALLYETGGWVLGDRFVPEVSNAQFVDNDLVKALVIQRFGETTPTLESVVSFFYTYPRYNRSAVDIGEVFNMAGDVGFYVPLVDFARAVARGKHTGKRNLVYHFDYYPKYMVTALQGIMHGQDLMYEFDMDHGVVVYNGGNASLWNDDDDWMGEAYRAAILNFVQYSNPADKLQSLLGANWLDFDLNNENYLSLSPRNTTLQHHLHARRASLWLDLLPKLRSLSTNETAGSQRPSGIDFIQSPPIIG